jgi:dihydropteroate synthase
MGIVNVTPDSFSDGGRHFEPTQAIQHAQRLLADGADILDVGGESTRPGAEPVPENEELRRILPVIETLAPDCPVPISIDTSKAIVARRALQAGAAIINDVTGLTGDPDMPAVAAEYAAGVVVMHMQGTPQTMQLDPQYPEGVLAAVDRFFESRLHELAAKGIAAEQVALDPGIGFGKTSAHNWSLISSLGQFARFGRPLCLGVSRKGLLGRLVDRPAAERDHASLAVACFALSRSGPLILRVHNVAATRDAVRVYEWIASSE